MHATAAIRRLPIFRGLPQEQIDRLLFDARLQTFNRGQVLFRQNDPANAIWIVVDGWIHLVRSQEADGQAHCVVLFTVTSHEALCGVSVIEPDTYTASGLAGTTCRVLRIPAASFTRMLAQAPAFTERILQLLARRIRQMAEQYGTMAEPVSVRLARTILRLRRQFGPTIPVTHRELAQMSWTTTESAIRTVRRLKRHGWLRGSRGRLQVVNVKALEATLDRRNGHS